MSHVYRRPPLAQYLQRRPRVFAVPAGPQIVSVGEVTETEVAQTVIPLTGGWASASGDLLLSVMEAASENEVYHVESVTTGETTWTHDGSVRQIITLGMHLNFLQTILPDNVGATDKSVRLPQVDDPVYFNS